jgi:hypothetical protein
MEGAMESEGQIRLSSLPWEISERLAQFRGNWLEYLTEANAIVLRTVQAVGCPALTGVACELITLIDSLPTELRESMPGGELVLKDAAGPLLRLVVSQGEVRIKWPNRSCIRGIPISIDSAPMEAGAEGVRIDGWARFAGSPGKFAEIRAFAEQFGGVFPSEDMPSECVQNTAYVRFRNASIDSSGLIARLRGLSDPLESLQADLEIVSEAPGLARQEVRIQIVDGRIEATKPALRK